MKKRKSVNLFVNAATGDEWLLCNEEYLCLINIIFPLCEIPKGAAILIPGVGKSRIGRELGDAGYTNVDVLDIEEEAVKYQKVIMKDRGKVLTIWEDEKTYDVILDKSFLDVFLRQNYTLAIEFGQRMFRMLKPTGILLVVSMFHKIWKRFLGKVANTHECFYTPHSAKPINTPGRRKRHRIGPISVLLISQNSTKKAQKLKKFTGTARNLKDLTTYEYPQCFTADEA